MRKEFVYDESKKLDGVITHLTRECGGNVHDDRIVNVTASSVYESIDDYHQKHAVDLVTDEWSCSNNEKNSWTCYDFKDRRVIPRSYSVRSYMYSTRWAHPKSWVIEVSNDGTDGSWTEIDRRENNNDLNGSYVTVNFKIASVPAEGYHFFRLRQTGENHRGNDCLVVNSLEIFGMLFEK